MCRSGFGVCRSRNGTALSRSVPIRHTSAQRRHSQPPGERSEPKCAARATIIGNYGVPKCAEVGVPKWAVRTLGWPGPTTLNPEATHMHGYRYRYTAAARDRTEMQPPRALPTSMNICSCGSPQLTCSRRVFFSAPPGKTRNEGPGMERRKNRAFTGSKHVGSQSMPAEGCSVVSHRSMLATRSPANERLEIAALFAVQGGSGRFISSPSAQHSRSPLARRLTTRRRRRPGRTRGPTELAHDFFLTILSMRPSFYGKGGT